MTLIQDVQALREETTQIMRLCSETASLCQTHEEQINGKRGIQAALNENTHAINRLGVALDEAERRVAKAAYWVAGVIIASSVGFAFSVLLLVGQ